jgi:uncharacterized protein
LERQCFASNDGARAVVPAFGAYTGGLSIRDVAFAKIFQTLGFTAHVFGDSRLPTIAASRCYLRDRWISGECFHLSAGA